MLAAVKPETPKRLTRNEQLKVVNEEAAKIWSLHQKGSITSEEASRRLKELQNRYVSFFDRILAL